MEASKDTIKKYYKKRTLYDKQIKKLIKPMKNLYTDELKTLFSNKQTEMINDRKKELSKIISDLGYDVLKLEYIRHDEKGRIILGIYSKLDEVIYKDHVREFPFGNSNKTYPASEYMAFLGEYTEKKYSYDEYRDNIKISFKDLIKGVTPEVLIKFNENFAIAEIGRDDENIDNTIKYDETFQKNIERNANKMIKEYNHSSQK